MLKAFSPGRKKMETERIILNHRSLYECLKFEQCHLDSVEDVLQLVTNGF